MRVDRCVCTDTTLADIVAAANVYLGFTKLFDKAYRAGIPNVTRWFDTLVHQPHFAAVLGAAGKRVLVVDADLRKGRMHQFLGLKRNNGLADVISGGLTLAGVGVAPVPDYLAGDDRSLVDLTIGVDERWCTEGVEAPVVRAFRDACGEAHMKAILGTGDLATLTNVARASMVAMMAGADFIKTSTGKEGVNATMPVSLVMVRQIREFHEWTGHAVGYKPAGGIRTAKQALEYLYLVKEELGERWMRPDLFRFGASGLLTDIERQLDHFAHGRYAAAYRQPMV